MCSEEICPPAAEDLCHEYIYTFDTQGFGTDASGTWITLTEDNDEWVLNVEPGNVATRVGTYDFDLHVCYADFPDSCAEV